MMQASSPADMPAVCGCMAAMDTSGCDADAVTEVASAVEECNAHAGEMAEAMAASGMSEECLEQVMGLEATCGENEQCLMEEAMKMPEDCMAGMMAMGDAMGEHDAYDDHDHGDDKE